jgi:hypothetical protein
LEDKSFLIDLFYSTLVIEERVETLVYDVVNFLAAAGGHLGLFLGFSCLSVLLAAIQVLKNKYN